MSAYQNTYTTKQASDISGASRQVIRVYTTRYARYLSTAGTHIDPSGKLASSRSPCEKMPIAPALPRCNRQPL